MTNFYRPSTYNADTRQQMWMSVIGDFHDSFCACERPFAHLLDIIFPEGHTDRTKRVDYIILRDFKTCPSGGEEEKSHGILLGESAATFKTEREEPTEEENLDTLLAAAAAAAEDTER